MSNGLTIKKAQKLSVKIFKKIERSKDFEGNMWDPFVLISDILEEAGEVAAVVKGLEGYKPPDKPKTRDMLASELSDLLYSIFALAEYYEIDLDSSFIKIVNSYEERFVKNISG